MSFVKVKEPILDDILDKVNSATVGLSISVYLEKEYGMTSEGIRSSYRNRLVNEGLIELKKATALNPANPDLDHCVITEKGKKFVKGAGYFGKRMREFEKFRNRKKSYITENKSIVTHALAQLELLEIEIKKIKNDMFRPDIGRCYDLVKLVIDKAFLPGHPILEYEHMGGMMKSDLLEFCQKGIFYLKFHTISEKVDFKNLHPEVISLSSKQFDDGHYREAVFNSFARLVEVVKDRYPIGEKNKLKDGVDLMQEVFSKDNPKVWFSEDGGERQGMMFLYSGAIGAIRNKYGHKTAIIKNKDYAFELLCFASALFRLLEDQSIY